MKEKNALTGGPPKPPKKIGGGLSDEPPDRRRVHLSDPVRVKDLAAAIQKKPFLILADLIGMKIFVPNERALIPFDVASQIASKRGFIAVRVE